MMKVIGLTGGIGTGKSTAADYFKEKGFAHIDADEVSRGLTAEGSELLTVLDGLFGPSGEWGDGRTEILDGEGRLKRKVLASLVFSDEERRAKLDEVMFREIIERIDSQIALFRRSGRDIKGILLDVPLLYEAGLDDRCDMVIVLVADEDVRIARVCSRDGMTPEEVRARIRNQMSDNEKIKRADAVIDNSEGISDLYENLDALFDEYMR